jgi:hypothetical protein
MWIALGECGGVRSQQPMSNGGCRYAQPTQGHGFALRERRLGFSPLLTDAPCPIEQQLAFGRQADLAGGSVEQRNA